MLILFANQKDRQLAASFERLIGQYGERKARRLRQRLDELDAASNLGDVRTLPAMRCQRLTDRPNLIAICTIPPSRMLLRVNGEPRFDEKPLIWQAVTTVTIIALDEISYE